MASDSYYLTAPTVRAKREMLLPFVAPEYLDALCAAVAEVAEAKGRESGADAGAAYAVVRKECDTLRAEVAALRKDAELAMEAAHSRGFYDGARWRERKTTTGQMQEPIASDSILLAAARTPAPETPRVSQGAVRAAMEGLQVRGMVRNHVNLTADLELLSRVEVLAVADRLDAQGAAPALSEADVAKFREWLQREMPAGTVIGDPNWWVPRILAAGFTRPKEKQTDETCVWTRVRYGGGDALDCGGHTVDARFAGRLVGKYCPNCGKRVALAAAPANSSKISNSSSATPDTEGTP